ncbi:MAG TPA: DUF4124 domain-containing protein [Marinobacter sp.]|uniref:DUF4124 domain-containing protein n=2 Tax=root TaxID=1 RepID=A0A831VUA9_9GAMM|nr:DUF4124 domain-containing protein [Marinobacter antarcticus]HDZ38668.1 DUF4124 domain-containing protein [Marinobacter sp.]HEA51463.1 DUF4124 domain-containing protein [Marinobacter antarcticus]
MPRMLATAFLIVVLSSPANAEIYSWTDANGVVHFTDTPPPDETHRLVEVAAPVTVPMANNLRQHRRVSKIHEQVQSLLSSDRKRASPRNHKGANAMAKQAKACSNYRRKLAQVQSQLRAGYGNNKGNSLRQKRRKLSQSLSQECILR